MATITKYPTANSAGTNAWTNPTNVYADDASYASAGSSRGVDYIQFYSSFDFQVPTGATINSITITMEWYDDGRSNGCTKGIAAYLGTSTLRGAETTTTTLTSSPTVLTLSNPGTWSVSELNTNSASGLNVRIRVNRGGSQNYPSFCDYVKVVIDYTPGATVVSGAANVTFTSTFAATGLKIAKGAANNTYSSTFSLIGKKIAIGAANVTYSSTFSAIAKKTTFSTVNVSYGSTFQAAALKIVIDAANVSYGSTFGAVAKKIVLDAATLTSGSTFALTGSVITVVVIVNGAVDVSFGSSIQAAGIKIATGSTNVGYGSAFSASGFKIVIVSAELTEASVLSAISFVLHKARAYLQPKLQIAQRINARALSDMVLAQRAESTNPPLNKKPHIPGIYGEE